MSPEMTLSLPAVARPRPERVAVVAPEVGEPTMARLLARGRDLVAGVLLRRIVSKRLAPFLAARASDEVDRLVRTHLTRWMLEVVVAAAMRRSGTTDFATETTRAIEAIEHARTFERDEDAEAWNALRVVRTGLARCLARMPRARLDGPTEGAFIRALMLWNVLLLWAATRDHQMSDEALARVVGIAMGDVDYVTAALVRAGAFDEE